MMSHISMLVVLVFASVLFWDYDFVSAASYSLTTSPAHIMANQTSRVQLNLRDESGAQLPLNQLQEMDKRKIHSVVLSSTYDSLFHVHLEDFNLPQMSDSNYWLDLSFPYGGSWLMNLDFTLAGTNQPTLHANTTVAVMGNIIPVAPYDPRSVKRFKAWTMDGPDRQINAITRSANELTTGGYEVTMNLNGGQPLTVSSCVPVVFSVKKASGDPDTTLQPLLGAAVHVLKFRFVDSKNFTFQHIHGWTGSQDIHGMGCQGEHMMEMEDSSRFGPSVMANVQFDAPGRWLIAAQMKRNGSDAGAGEYGQLLTAMYDITVGGTSPSSPPSTTSSTGSATPNPHDVHQSSGSASSTATTDPHNVHTGGASVTSWSSLAVIIILFITLAYFYQAS